MSEIVEQGDVKQIIVQLGNGSTWTAEIGLDGKMRLLKQLSDPTKPDVEEKAKPGDEYEQPKPTEEEGAEGEADEGDEQPAEWGEEAKEYTDKYSDDEIDKLIESMEHAELRRGDIDRKKRKVRVEMPAGTMERAKDNAFKARLSSVMLDNKYDRRTKGRTRGKLDMTRLHKVPTGSRSVFTQKESRKGKLYNVVLLVDESGSMGGRKATLAAESAVFLTKQLTDIGCNVGIIGFQSAVHVHKELLEKPDYAFIYGKVAYAPGENSDYQGLRRAYHMLKHAPQGKKILIMLSDGAPTGFENQATYDADGKRENILPELDTGIDWESKEHFHHLVRSQKDVASIGIGIQEGGWQIPDHTVIHDVGDLKKTIIAALRKHINRG